MANPDEVKFIAQMLTEDPDIMNERGALPHRGGARGPEGAFSRSLSSPEKQLVSQGARALSGKGLECPNCGTMSSSMSKKCRRCGSLISYQGARGQERATALACPKCGGPWEQGEGACQYCGTTGRPISRKA